ncbi:MAG: hypothetical protein KBT20_04875 [Bacteroidales bacterium]|nr:hypothetical protein [Candidatus Liminaster caballi]
MKKFIPSLAVALTVSLMATAIPVKAQEERVIALPSVEVDTTAFPALRILKQLQEHEKEDRFETLKSFDVHTEGAYMWTFSASKFMRGYLRGMMTAMGFPRLSKLYLGNDTVTYSIHAHQQFVKGGLKDVDIMLDSSNIELTDKQHKVIKRSNLMLEDKILAQFRSPKQPWGSKRFGQYEWFLVDTLTMDGHRVDVLHFSSRPKASRTDRILGPVDGTIWVIEDYWRIVGYERTNRRNRSAIRTHLEQVAPGVFLPTEFIVQDDMTMDAGTIMAELGINPDSITENKKEKLDKVLKKSMCSMTEGYRLRMEYENVTVK